MRNVNAIVMDYDEFDYIVGIVSNGGAGIGFESGEWFYVSGDEYDIDNINKDLSDYLHVNVKNVRIDALHEYDEVIIICE